MKKILYTIGHSTHSIEEFIALLEAYEIAEVVDIRSIPKSRHNPQFNSEELAASLKKKKIRYKHLKKLGGLRHTTKDSPNLGWHHLSFRGFADYMQTADFQEGLNELEELAKERRTALMCAEAVPWRCHRSLVADALTLEKWHVYHIQSKTTAHLHTRTPFLKVKRGMITYP